MTVCAISLGGNLGDVPATFVAAAHMLQATGVIARWRMSRIYRTAPMGAAAGDVFHNAAAVFETTLEPLPLLDRLQEVEHRCGRVRTIHWGPRTLDLDLMLYGDEIIDTPRLAVPHPAMWCRRFVLDPLAELMPDAVHPVFHESIRQMRDRMLERPLPVGWAVPTAAALTFEMAGTAHPAVRWITEDGMKSAAIVFAGMDVQIVLPRVIRLPEDEAAAMQMMHDVLTAALDAPEAEGLRPLGSSITEGA